MRLPSTAQPMRLLVGFPAGGASHTVARLLAPELARELGRPVAVESHPGEDGARAARLVAAAAPDGSTLFVATLGTHAIAPQLGAPPYDARADFAPVALLARSPLVLVVWSGLAARTVPELIAAARAAPAALGCGSSALRGAPRLAAALFERMAGIEFAHARYERTPDLYADLGAGRIALSFNNVMSALPRCAHGELRALALTARARSRAAPELPTVAESGLAGYEVSNWFGIVAPAGTPAAALDRLASACARALRSRRVGDEFARYGVEAGDDSRERFAAFLERERARWAPLAARLAAGRL